MLREDGFHASGAAAARLAPAAGMRTHGPFKDCEPLSSAEFDAHAPGYAAGMEHSLKALLGETAEQYVQLKLRWLVHRYPSLREEGATTRVLDYGCGTATLLGLIAAAGIHATLVGCDVSPRMLEEAERRWPKSLEAAKPELRLQQGACTPFPPGGFDLVVVSAVLHHVPPLERPQVYAELCRVTRPGGQIVVFEHNPLNPVTRYVVAHTPIDQNAVLLPAREVQHGLAAAGATDVRTRYIMFAPPRLRMPNVLEMALGWLPLGAQYVVTATTGTEGISRNPRRCDDRTLVILPEDTPV